MAFERLEYEKVWTSPEDFPTYEDSEAQVRADLQYHPDAIRDFLNEKLVAALESGAGAASIQTAGGSLQAVLDRMNADIQTVAAGGVPSVSQCVAVPFDTGQWTEGADGWTLAVPETVHRRGGAGFGFALWALTAGEYRRSWGTAATQVSPVPDGEGDITLAAPEPYDGLIVFFGV